MRAKLSSRPRKPARKHGRRNRAKRLIKVTYETVHPSEPDVYPEIENGWEDEDGVEVKLDRYDLSEGYTIASKAAKMLLSEGATEPSSMPYHPGTWYTSEGDMDYRSGETTSKSYHLYGFTETEEREIYKLVTKR